MKYIFKLITSVLLIFLTGCSTLAPLLDSLTTPTSAPVIQATSTPKPLATPTPTRSTEPNILRVWLPPRFDPSADTPSGKLLKQRLADFESEHLGLKIEVRVKAEDGSNDLLHSLALTNLAAPSIAPDLIALSYSDLQSAGQQGLIHPIDGLSSLLQDPNWYAFAREVAHFQNSEFGLPFVANALVIVYRPAVFSNAPTTWGAIFDSGNKITFSPSDPKAYFPLSLYLSQQSNVVDAQGNLVLDQATLTRVLALYKNALDSGAIPATIKDYQTDQQAIQAFHDGGAGASVIWISSDLSVKSGKYLPLFSLDNDQYTLVDGWAWALGNSDVEKQSLAMELASYLVDSDYMSTWANSIGSLPTRPQALDGWDDQELKASVNEVLQNSHPVPTDDVVAKAGPILQQALIRIFNGEQPEAVARSVVENPK